MPKLTGVFDIFSDLDKIPIPDIASWLRAKGNIHTLQNFLGNRIIYPQTIPVTKDDLEVDLAILREAVIRQPNKFYDQKGKIIMISQEFERRFPSFVSLVTTLIECINPQDITYLYLKSSGLNSLMGSIIAPENPGTGQAVPFSVNGKFIANLNPGSLTLFPYKDKQLRIKIGTSIEKLIPGGELGIIIDLRRWT